MIGALILLLPPVLAIYSVMLRNKALKAGQVGYVYEGKTWVSWVAVVAILATLFLTFGAPLITKHVDYAPDWEKLKLLIFVLIEYISYVLVSYRPATADEIEEAKASGTSAINMTTSAAASMLSIIVSCILGALASIPMLIYNALNPVKAIKVIGGVTYKIIGTGFTSIVGGIVGLGILAAIVAMVLLFGSVLAALGGMFVLGAITIYQFIKIKKASK